MKELLYKIISALDLKFSYGSRKGCIMLYIENADHYSTFVLGNTSVERIDCEIPSGNITIDEVIEQELDYEFGVATILKKIVTCEEFASELAELL